MLVEVKKNAQGFTLIEILVVILVIGVVMGVVGFSFSSSNSSYVVNGFAQRLAQRIEMVRGRAIQSNTEWGMFVEEDDYRFANFDQSAGEWFDYTIKPFVSETLNYTVRYQVAIRDYPGRVATDDDTDLPDIVFFSSGEVSPFELTLRANELTGTSWKLQSDGFSIVRAERVDEQ